jgi:hypothetical protein
MEVFSDVSSMGSRKAKAAFNHQMLKPMLAIKYLSFLFENARTREHFFVDTTVDINSSSGFASSNSNKGKKGTGVEYHPPPILNIAVTMSKVISRIEEKLLQANDELEDDSDHDIEATGQQFVENNENDNEDDNSDNASSTRKKQKNNTRQNRSGRLTGDQVSEHSFLALAIDLQVRLLIHIAAKAHDVNKLSSESEEDQYVQNAAFSKQEILDRKSKEDKENFNIDNVENMNSNKWNRKAISSNAYSPLKVLFDNYDDTVASSINIGTAFLPSLLIKSLVAPSASRRKNRVLAQNLVLTLVKLSTELITLGLISKRVPIPQMTQWVQVISSTAVSAESMQDIDNQFTSQLFPIMFKCAYQISASSISTLALVDSLNQNNPSHLPFTFEDCTVYLEGLLMAVAAAQPEITSNAVVKECLFDIMRIYSAQRHKLRMNTITLIMLRAVIAAASFGTTTNDTSISNNFCENQLSKLAAIESAINANASNNPVGSNINASVSQAQTIYSTYISTLLSVISRSPAACFSLPGAMQNLISEMSISFASVPAQISESEHTGIDVKETNSALHFNDNGDANTNGVMATELSPTSWQWAVAKAIAQLRGLGESQIKQPAKLSKFINTINQCLHVLEPHVVGTDQINKRAGHELQQSELALKMMQEWIRFRSELKVKQNVFVAV